MLLNQEKVNEAQQITLRLKSPSRPQIDIIKSLTKISTGFYSFVITPFESHLLEDNSYRYQILQNDEFQNELILKIGKVRLIETQQLINSFDFTLDFTIA